MLARACGFKSHRGHKIMTIKYEKDNTNYPFLEIHNDSIAQLVEHITFNDGVLGSSPSRVTNSDQTHNLLESKTR